MNTLTDTQNRNLHFLLYLGSIVKDRVFMAMLLLLILLAAFDFPQLSISIGFTLEAL